MANAIEIVQTVMQQVQGLAKKDKNQAQGFNFRGIDAVMNAVGPALRTAGGFITPTILEKTNDVLPARNGGSMQVVRLTVQYSVYGSEGAPVVGVVAAEAFDSGDKATAKAMSVAYRTFLLQLLCLPTDEPDPDAHSYEIAGGVDTNSLVAWGDAVNDATTMEELKQIWGEVAGFCDTAFKHGTKETTLKQLINTRKASLSKVVSA